MLLVGDEPYEGWSRMKVGDRAPDLALVDQNGDEVTIGGLLQSGPLVVYFYIKAMTPG